MLTRMRPGVLSVHFTSTVPCSRLYLIALESRLMRTCFARVRSARTKYGMSNRGKVMLMPRCCACGSIMDWHSDMTSANDTGSGEIDNFPDGAAGATAWHQ